MIFRTYQ